jgi:hypothetical protein
MWVKVTQNGTNVEVRVYEREGAERPMSLREGPFKDVLFRLTEDIRMGTSADGVELGSDRFIRARYKRLVVASKKIGKIRLIVEDHLPSAI